MKSKDKTSKETKEEKVGYKNPPKETQFKKGQSGNPSGRPPGSRNLKTLLREILAEEIDADTNEVLQRLQQIFPNRFKGKKTTIQEAFNLRLVMMALGTEPRLAFQAISQIYDRAEGRPSTVIEKIDSEGNELEDQVFKLPGGLTITF